MILDTGFEVFQDRKCPEWFAKPQMGVFIHWGLYSVPAWAPHGQPLDVMLRENYDNGCAVQPYAEWYANAIKIPGSPSAIHHKAHYGEAPYTDFRAPFDAAADAFDADNWVDLFAKADAQYVVFVTKHHDGYCLWPTEVENPHRPGWHSKRDFVGELAEATRKRGLKFGVYYSGGLDWTFRHEPIHNLGEMLGCIPTGDDYRSYAGAQVRELIARYQPSVLWNDIGWPNREDLPSLFADYYAAVPDGVINDRWLGESAMFEGLRNPDMLTQFNTHMKATISRGESIMSAPLHADYRTIEYGLGEPPENKKWEACRGVGLSFGHNQNEDDKNYLDHKQLVELRDTVLAEGGNFLINVGPMADGSIPDVQRRALIGQ